MTGDHGDHRGTIMVPVKTKPEQWLTLSGDHGDHISLATYQNKGLASSISMGRQAGRVGAYIGEMVPMVPMVPRLGCLRPFPSAVYRHGNNGNKGTGKIPLIGGTRSPGLSAPNMKMKIGIPAFTDITLVTGRN